MLVDPTQADICDMLRIVFEVSGPIAGISFMERKRANGKSPTKDCQESLCAGV